MVEFKEERRMAADFEGVLVEGRLAAYFDEEPPKQRGAGHFD